MRKIRAVRAVRSVCVGFAEFTAILGFAAWFVLHMPGFAFAAMTAAVIALTVVAAADVWLNRCAATNLAAAFREAATAGRRAGRSEQP